MISQPQILDNFKFLAALNLSHSITAGTVVSPDNIAKGEVVVVDMGNVVLDTTTVLTASEFKIVMGRGAGVPLVESKPIKPSEIKNYAIKAYQPKVQEVLYYGYNAVTNTGAFDVINSNYYDLNLSFQNLWGTEASSMYIPVGGTYQSTSTATEANIVNGLFKNVAANLVRFNPKIATVELISGGASGATDAGITIPVGALSATLATIAAASSVGDYVRLGTTDADGMYKIVSIVGPVVTWDVPVQVGVTSATVSRVAAATAAAGNFGLKVTGVNQPFILDSRPVFLVEFQGGLKNGGATPIVKQVTPFIGNGTYELCRQEEAASWRNQGILYNYTEFPPTSIPTDLNESGVYSMINIGWENASKTMLTTGQFKGNILIAGEITTVGTPNVYSDNVVGDSISVADVIDAVATATGFTSQLGNL
jgi:hypothetical protein